MKKMEKKIADLRRYTIEDLEMKDDDLQMILTFGVTVSGTFLNLLKLKKVLDDLPEIKVIYPTFSTSHLRIVKKEYWEEYNQWRRKKGMPERLAEE